MVTDDRNRRQDTSDSEDEYLKKENHKTSVKKTNPHYRLSKTRPQKQNNNQTLNNNVHNSPVSQEKGNYNFFSKKNQKMSLLNNI